jgi:hypothetical protein
MSSVSGGFTPSALHNLVEGSPAQSARSVSSGSTSLGGISGKGSSNGDSAQISGLAQLYGQLQQLQSQNPAQFKQVTSEIATQLQSASARATGSDASFLANLATKFQTASATGDASSLKPAQFGPTTNPPGVWQILLAALSQTVQ